MKARISEMCLSVMIDAECGSIEVYYISFPRHTGTHCYASTLVPEQRQRLERALVSAQEVCDRMINDGRQNASEKEIRKAFNRTFEVNEGVTNDSEMS